LIIQLKAALANEARFLDIVMPNGKKIGECTGQYIREVGEPLHCFEFKPSA
jgi:hypothetical protein